jgi:Na+-translocating ferredoxin:NAD+ oxidoreductase RnfE subunit
MTKYTASVLVAFVSVSALFGLCPTAAIVSLVVGAYYGIGLAVAENLVIEYRATKGTK